MNKLPLIASLLTITSLPAISFAGGEMTATQYSRSTTMSSRSALETRQRNASLQAGLYPLEMQAALAAQAAIGERKAKVTVVRAVQDKYGDPTYTWYGPLPVEKGTPMYDGPRYAASFDRGYLEPVPDGQYRGYAR